MKTYVLYHANCWDGFCAAWVARKVLGADAEYIPVQHGQEPPVIEPGSQLYILDFSYSREQLFKWWTPGPNAVKRLVVLDHHKTAQEALRGFDEECVANGMDEPNIVFNMEHSGGRLAWEHFFGNEHRAKFSNPDDLRPWLVDYTEDRDLFRKMDGEVESDETFIGGKAKNMHKAVREQKIKGRGPEGKTAVQGILERDAECSHVRVFVVGNTEAETLQGNIVRNVEMEGTRIYTDAAPAYSTLSSRYMHACVNRSANTFVDRFTRTGWKTSGVCSSGRSKAHGRTSPRSMWIDTQTSRHGGSITARWATEADSKTFSAELLASD